MNLPTGKLTPSLLSRDFYFMTVTELIKQSGVKYKRKDLSVLGKIIQNKAREQKVRWTKVDEVISVNDFPETFIEEMQNTVADYFTSKTTNNANIKK